MGRAEGARRAPARAGIPVKGAATLLRMNQPRGLRLPRLRLARSEAHLVVRVLRERRQGGRLGSDGASAARRNSSPRTPSPSLSAGATTSSRWSGGSPIRWPMTRPRDRYRAGELGRRLRHASAGISQALPDPNMAEFYTSGRTSNEAAFLYQLFVREYGTNNFPDCSNMCHEATSVGLPQSHRRRQGHGAAGGFRQGRLHLHLRPEPRHQQPAHDDEPAQRVPPRRHDHLASIRSANVRWSASSRRRVRSRW